MNSNPSCTPRGIRIWMCLTRRVAFVVAVGTITPICRHFHDVLASNLYLECDEFSKNKNKNLHNDNAPEQGAQEPDARHPTAGCVHEVKDADAFVPQMAEETTDLWLINYYAGWCPHCITFAPAWKELAGKYQKQNVHFGAVNCEVQTQWCAQVGVSAYPTLRAYHIRKEDKSRAGDGKPIELSQADKHGKDRIQLYTGLIDAILQTRYGGRGSGSDSAEASSSASAPSGASAPSAPSASAEDPPSPPVSSSEQQLLLTESSPWRFSDDGSTLFSARERDAAVGLLQNLKLNSFLRVDVGTGHLPPKVWAELLAWLAFVAEYFPRAKLRADLQQLTSTLRKAEAPTQAHQWSAILANWAASPERQDALVKEVFSTSPSSSSSSSASAPDVHVSGSGSGPSPAYHAVNSFTGALWQLLHILSASVDRRHPATGSPTVRGSRGGPDHVHDEDLNSEPQSLRTAGGAADAFPAERRIWYDRLRGFVDNFFGCEECRRHFLDRFDKCAFGRCDAKHPAALFLWELHNRVTQRVYRENVEHHHEDLSIQNIEPKLLFPSVQQCPGCYLKEPPRRGRQSAVEKSKWKDFVAEVKRGSSGRPANSASKNSSSASRPDLADEDDEEDGRETSFAGKAATEESTQLFYQIFDKKRTEAFLLAAFLPGRMSSTSVLAGQPAAGEVGGGGKGKGEGDVPAGASSSSTTAGELKLAAVDVTAGAEQLVSLHLMPAVGVLFFLLFVLYTFCRKKVHLFPYYMSAVWKVLKRRLPFSLSSAAGGNTLVPTRRPSSASNQQGAHHLRALDNLDTQTFELDLGRGTGAAAGVQRVGAFAGDEMI